MGGRGSRPMSEKQLNEHRQVSMLQSEVEAMGDMFTRMNRQCYEKCLNAELSARSNTDDLSLDDDHCVASCASKFVCVQQKVSEIFMEEAKRTPADQAIQFG